MAPRYSSPPFPLKNGVLFSINSEHASINGALFSREGGYISRKGGYAFINRVSSLQALSIVVTGDLTATACPTLSCPNACSGAGVCEYGACRCNDGVKGTLEGSKMTLHRDSILVGMRGVRALLRCDAFIEISFPDSMNFGVLCL